MLLPLYLAMTAAEMQAKSSCPLPCAYMACQFSPYTEGITNIPETLPENSILILNDRMSCCGHRADLVAGQLAQAVEQLQCESVLLDFLRPPEPESKAMVEMIIQTLPCPVAVSEGFAKELTCPVFLSPGPLHLPLAEHIAPWQGRDIWLEAALCQEEVTVTESRAEFNPVFPTQKLEGGFYDEALRCHYHTTASEHAVFFTLFDTPQSLEKKLELAHSLGIKRAVGLYQELGTSF